MANSQYIQKCPKCGGTLIINKETNLLECERCESPVNDGVSDRIRERNSKVAAEIRNRNSLVDYDRLMKQNELNYQKQKTALIFDKVIKVLLLVLAMGMFGYMFLTRHSESINERMSAPDGFVNVPGKASSLIGKNFEDVARQFESSGFTNIELVETWETVSYNATVQNGRVKTVSVDGYTSFDQFADFRPDSLVRITYTNYEKKSPPIRVNSSAESYRGENVSVVKAEFEALGFNVQLEEIKDLTTGLLIHEGTVERVSIAGNSSFEKGTTFDGDAVVIIAYHAFK